MASVFYKSWILNDAATGLLICVCIVHFLKAAVFRKAENQCAMREEIASAIGFSFLLLGMELISFTQSIAASGIRRIPNTVPYLAECSTVIGFAFLVAAGIMGLRGINSIKIAVPPGQHSEDDVTTWPPPPHVSTMQGDHVPQP